MKEKFKKVYDFFLRYVVPVLLLATMGLFIANMVMSLTEEKGNVLPDTDITAPADGENETPADVEDVTTPADGADVDTNTDTATDTDTDTEVTDPVEDEVVTIADVVVKEDGSIVVVYTDETEKTIVSAPIVDEEPVEETVYVADLRIDEDYNVVIVYSDGTEKVLAPEEEEPVEEVPATMVDVIIKEDGSVVVVYSDETEKVIVPAPVVDEPEVEEPEEPEVEEPAETVVFVDVMVKEDGSIVAVYSDGSEKVLVSAPVVDEEPAEETTEVEETENTAE